MKSAAIPTTGPRRHLRGHRIALALALSLVSLLVLTAAPAQATKTHLFLGKFGSVAEPKFSRASTVALDPTTDTLLVVDPHEGVTDAGTISRFNLDGTPADFSALGTNVIDGIGIGDQTPQQGLTFGVHGAENQIAIDDSGTITDGNIYVTQAKEVAGNLIDVFAPNGEYLGQLTGAGPTKFGSASFPFSPCGAAVDGAGNLFVGAGYDRKIYKFDPSAKVPLASDVVATYSHSGPVCGLAAGAEATADSIFATAFVSNPFEEKDNLLELSRSDLSLQAVLSHDRDPGVIAVDPTNGHLYVKEVTFGGNETGVINEFDVSGSSIALVSQFELSGLSGIAIDDASGKLYLSSSNLDAGVYVFGPLVTVPDVTTGNATITGDTSVTLNGTVDPDGEPLEECRFDYGTTTQLGESVPCAETVGEIGASKAEVHADLSGLDPETTYFFQLVAKNVNASVPGEVQNFKTPAKPAIAGLWSQEVSYTEATLKARIGPENSPTTYRFEWGPDSSYGNATAEIPVGSDQSDHTVSLPLTGLEAGATYHYRVVATNGIGVTEAADHTFTTYPALRAPKSDCPNQAFRSGPSARLPECRAYEMVSPVDKNGGDIKVLVSALNYPARLEQSAVDGNRYAYSSGTAFAGAVSAPWTSSYVATRNAGQGWSTQAINPPISSVSDALIQYKFDTRFKAYSPDLADGWLFQDTGAPLDECAPEGFPNLYRRDVFGGGYEALMTEKPISAPPGFGLELQGLSADGSHAIFRSQAKLIKDAASAGSLETMQIYEHIAGEGCGELRLVSVLPNGKAAPVGSSLGSPGFGLEGREGSVLGAVSADGSRIFWSRGSGTTGAGPLYVRIDGKATDLITTEDAKFWLAARDGSRAFYSIENSGSPNFRKLYEYDVEAETSTLIAEGSLGVVGAGEDASRLYFVSEKTLDGDAQPGQPNLYLREQGTTRFIATVSKQDFGAGPRVPVAIVGEPSIRGLRVTPDGETLVFPSNASLTGYDNNDAGDSRPAMELYRYVASSDQLSCISCNPSGARPAGRSFEGSNGSTRMVAAMIPGWENQLYAPRALSKDGKRLFFQAFDPLLPRDVNGQADVYEWQAAADEKECEEAGADLYVASSGGCLSLISSGLSTTDSELADASVDGSDVFIRTASSLLPQDPGQVDLYDARVGGGLPIPAGPPAACEGEACQGSVAAPNDPTPASAGYQGAENAKPPCKPGKVWRKGRCVPRCKKGQVLRKGRCVHKKRQTSKHHKQASDKRRAGR
jgi:hypothetical protein